MLSSNNPTNWSSSLARPASPYISLAISRPAPPIHVPLRTDSELLGFAHLPWFVKWSLETWEQGGHKTNWKSGQAADRATESHCCITECAAVIIKFVICSVSFQHCLHVSLFTYWLWHMGSDQLRLRDGNNRHVCFERISTNKCFFVYL